MPNLALTDLAIRSLKSDTRQDFWDTKLSGFGVRVGPRSKTFIVKVGNARRAVGAYPETSLADARRSALALKSQKPTARQTVTFETAYDDFKKHHVAPKKASTRASYLRMMDGYFLPEFRHRGLDTITHRQVAAVTDALLNRPGEQWHAIAVGRTFFKFCVRRHYISASPMEGVQVAKNRPRDRVLTDAEIKQLWTATKEERPFNQIVRLLLLTGQRRGEISALEPAWIGDEYITLPKEITKNGREHRVPLASIAAEILGRAIPSDPKERGQFVFPARGRNDASFNGWAKSKTALDKALGLDFAPWTLHDLRRTFATNMARLGVRLEVTERLLNQVSGSLGGIVAVYQRYDFQCEMREAIERWEMHLSTLVAEP